jgi:hypothetical protein
VAGPGDVDGDGVPDLVVGNGTFITSFVGVYSGADGGLIRQHTATTSDALGACVSGAGDVDGDGVPDYIAGAPHNGCSPAGGVLSFARVWSGATGAELHTFTADSCLDLGTSVACAGDVDGDGHADLIVGATAVSYTAQGLPGFVRVYSGLTGEVLLEFVGHPPTENNEPYSPVSERFGASVGGAGDVNGDGVPDLLVGVPYAGGSALNSRGELRVYSGRFGTLLYSLKGSTPGGHLGEAVLGPGDLNGDGLADVAAGSPRATVGGQTVAGSVRVWSAVPVQDP